MQKIQLYKGRQATLLHTYKDPDTLEPISISGFIITGAVKKNRNDSVALITLSSAGSSPNVTILESGVNNTGQFNVSFSAASSAGMVPGFYLLGYSYTDSDGPHFFGEVPVEIMLPVDATS